MQKDPQKIRNMFSKIADKYDFTNGVLSFQMHKWWNQKLVNAIAKTEVNTLLDLCAGTGEIAFRWLNQQKEKKTAILLDFCPEMLAIAQQKAEPYINKGHTVRFLQADAAEIPLPAQSIEAVSVAYGIRNVANLKGCFNEVFRVLKPKGVFFILELTEPRNRVLRSLHRFYLNRALPRLGGFVTNEKDIYQYLSTSIQEFIEPVNIQEMLYESGFVEVKIHRFLGGIATLLIASKTASAVPVFEAAQLSFPVAQKPCALVESAHQKSQL